MRFTPVLLALSAASLLACEPLVPAPQTKGPLPIEVLSEEVGAIPLAYGKLVAVTPIQAYDYVQTLWFVQPDETIVSVRVDVALGKITQVMTIPRR